MMKIARIVFYVELLINLFDAAVSFFAPASFVSIVTPQAIPAVPLELIRWYGVLLFVFVYIMFRALRSKNDDTLSIVVEGFLLSDVLNLIAYYLFGHAAGDFSTVIVNAIITVILASSRTSWLVGHYRQKTQKITA